jgi:dTDP-L-rhamnose 4-epimerase
MPIGINTRTRVLVTGGAGFIGSHVVDQLVEAGHEVGIIDSLVPQVHGRQAAGWWPSWTMAHQGVIRERADVRDRVAVMGVLRAFRPHCVVHLAAEVGVGQAEVEIERYVDANSHGTAVLLQAVLDANDSASDDEGCRRVIVAGSMSAYGEGAYVCEEHGMVRPERSAHDLAAQRWEPQCPFAGTDVGCSTPRVRPVPIHEWSHQNPGGVYAATKRDQESLALLVGRARGLSVAVPRFFNVVGARQSLTNPYTGVAAIFGARARAGLAPRVYEDGNQARDIVDVRDAARAVRTLVGSWQLRSAIQAWQDASFCGPFNVSTGVPTTIAEIARQAVECVGFAADQAERPAPVITGQYRIGDIRSCIGHPGRMEMLGWKPELDAWTALGEVFARVGMEPAPEMSLDDHEAAHRALVSRSLVTVGADEGDAGTDEVEPPAPPQWVG